jgi:hypothetical protein
MIVTMRIRKGLFWRYLGVELMTAMAKKLIGGAVGAVGLAADVAKHLAWYVSHQMSSQPRDPS